MKIAPGDVVELRPGGTLMNVRSVGDGHALCSWYDLEGRRHTQQFPLDALTVFAQLPASPPDQGPETGV